MVPHPNVPMRVQFEHLLAENNLSLSGKYIETDSLIVIRSLLIESDRIALVSKNQVYLDEKLGFLKIVPIKLKIPLRPIGFVTLSDFSPTPNLTEFLSYLRQVAAEITHWKRN